MPFPNALRRTNRRFLNPIVRTFAGRIPPFSIVTHRGRTSGRVFHTPIMAFRVEGGFAIALTYGADTDWVKNVRAAGACELRYRSKDHDLANPRIVGGAASMDAFPAPIRFILGRAHVENVMLLDNAEGA